MAETEKQLVEEFASFCKTNNLPLQSADELLYGMPLTPIQGEYLAKFIVRWDKASDAADKALNALESVKVCECGVNTVGAGKHSHFCPLF